MHSTKRLAILASIVLALGAGTVLAAKGPDYLMRRRLEQSPVLFSETNRGTMYTPGYVLTVYANGGAILANARLKKTDGYNTNAPAYPDKVLPPGSLRITRSAPTRSAARATSASESGSDSRIFDATSPF